MPQAGSQSTLQSSSSLGLRVSTLNGLPQSTKGEANESRKITDNQAEISQKILSESTNKKIVRPIRNSIYSRPNPLPDKKTGKSETKIYSNN